MNLMRNCFLRKNEVSNYQKQLRILATEVFKSLADINPDFMKSYFTIKQIPYCLRNGNFLKIPLSVMERIQ